MPLQVQVCTYNSLHGILQTTAHACVYVHATFLVRNISIGQKTVFREVWQNMVSIVIPVLLQINALDTK